MCPPTKRTLLALACGFVLSALPGSVWSQEPAPGRRALLVGVGAYPESSGWPQLTGPTRDVENMRRALVAHAGFAPESITVLNDNQATRAAILESFAAMIDAAAPGELLLFFFAGHGSFLEDDDGDELDDGFDETLVPYDGRAPDGTREDIRDDQIRALVRAANLKTDQVALIFDCCNSGTNVRGEVAGIRGVPGERGLGGTRKGGKARPVNAAAKRPDEDDKGSTEGMARLAEGLDYVALSACRADQTAAEIALPNDQGVAVVQGLFTNALVAELAQAGAATSYDDLMAGVRQRVTSRRAAQSPVLEGSRQRYSLIAGGFAAEKPFFRVEDADGQPMIDGGRVHGLAPGVILDLCAETARRANPADYLGRLRVVEAGATRSRAEWLVRPPTNSGLARLRAFETGREDRLVVFVAGEGAATEALRAAIDEHAQLSNGAADAAAYHLQLDPADGPYWRLRTPDGFALPLTVAPGADIALFLERLARLGIAQSLAAVTRENGSRLRFSVEWQRSLASAPFEPVGPPRRAAAGEIGLDSDELLLGTLRNLSSEPVYVSLLLIAPDGEINVVWETPDDEPIRPNEERRTRPIRFAVPAGAEAFYARGRQLCRFVIATEPFDLHDFEQPPVTELERTRGGGMEPPPPGRNALSGDWATRSVALRMGGTGG
ncbi:MAG TPA: caspase family protein [Planctomycetota bacterium]